jgi:hypothetical protein
MFHEKCALRLENRNPLKGSVWAGYVADFFCNMELK